MGAIDDAAAYTIDGVELSYLSTIPKKVTFNPYMYLGTTFDQAFGTEIDAIPDIIDVNEVNPYFGFWPVLLNERYDAFYSHSWGDTGITIDSMRREEYEYPPEITDMADKRHSIDPLQRLR